MVQLHLQVRRFFCKHKGCNRQTFAETYPELVNYKARRTKRLNQQQLAVAFAVSGEAGSRLLPLLAMPLSGDTLIREIRATPDEPIMTPVVLGIDDWAKKRGHTYGTILVNLETREPIDLLDSREAEDVASWLKQHPGIEVISRDRGHEYAKAARLGAPEAQQVADRWHLLKNLREAVKTMLSHKPSVLVAAGKPNDVKHEIMASEAVEEAKTAVNTESTDEEEISVIIKAPPTKAEQDKAARHASREARFELVNELHQEGYSKRAIQKHLNMSWRTVHKYINVDTCPQYSGRIWSSKLTPWLPYLEKRWQAGYTNATQLWRDLAPRPIAGRRLCPNPAP